MTCPPLTNCAMVLLLSESQDYACAATRLISYSGILTQHRCRTVLKCVCHFLILWLWISLCHFLMKPSLAAPHGLQANRHVVIVKRGQNASYWTSPKTCCRQDLTCGRNMGSPCPSMPG